MVSGFTNNVKRIYVLHYDDTSKRPIRQGVITRCGSVGYIEYKRVGNAWCGWGNAGDKSFDVALMDIQMPPMPTWTVLNRLP
jgi:CheY-like chemotaxis protein